MAKYMDDIFYTTPKKIKSNMELQANLAAAAAT